VRDNSPPGFDGPFENDPEYTELDVSAWGKPQTDDQQVQNRVSENDKTYCTYMILTYYISVS